MHHVKQMIALCAGRWCYCGTRKASESSSWRPTSSELTGTRKHKGGSLSFTVSWSKKDPSDGNISVSFVSKPECGWVLCFHGYQRAAVLAQGSRQRSSRGTCWSTWRPTVHRNSRNGFSESKSTTCQRPGEHDEHWSEKSSLLPALKLQSCNIQHNFVSKYKDD